MVRVIKELRPTWVVGENVAGIVRMALHDILSELEACGYRTRTFLIPACAVGARHRRYRVAIVGYSEHNGSSSTEIAGSLDCRKNVSDTNGTGCEEQHVSAEPDKEGFTGWRCDEGNVCNATGERLPDRASEPLGGQRTQEQESERPMRRTVESVLGGVASRIPDRMDGDLDFIINHYWDEEPGIPRIATGIEHRVDRLKCLGNAVVPQQFYPIFKAIAEVEKP